MPKSGRFNPQQAKVDQQGAKGRLTSNPSQPPILTPRTSKVPAQDSDFLTTSQGARLPDTDDSLTAGQRGPTLMEDLHLREKIMHFDHERIPERVVHARGYIQMPRQVEGAKVRERGPDDEHAQATMFWNSMSEIEKDHIVDAYTFELGKVEVASVVDRMVTRLMLVDTELARRVSVGLGLPAGG